MRVWLTRTKMVHCDQSRLRHKIKSKNFSQKYVVRYVYGKLIPYIHHRSVSSSDFLLWQAVYCPKKVSCPLSWPFGWLEPKWLTRTKTSMNLLSQVRMVDWNRNGWPNQNKLEIESTTLRENGWLKPKWLTGTKKSSNLRSSDTSFHKNIWCDMCMESLYLTYTKDPFLPAIFGYDKPFRRYCP